MSPFTAVGHPEEGTLNSPGAPRPRIVSWNLTRVCNLACGHCYLDATQRRSEAADELSTDEALQVVEDLGRMARGAMLVLTGGEPLLRRDLDRLVAAASSAELMPVVGTNGLLLGPARASALRSAGAAGVGISIDSATRTFHDRLRGMDGAWARAIDGARAARAAGLGVLLQTTLFEENRGDLEAMIGIARDVGAMALNVFFLVCTGRGVCQTDLSGARYDEALARILALQDANPDLLIRARCAPYVRRLRGLRAGEGDALHADWSSACLAGREYFRITPSGDVTACPYIPASAGNVRVAPLDAVWARAPGFQRLREETPGGKCGVCDFRVSCGGCRARALVATGDLLGEDAKCTYVPAVTALPERRERPVSANAVAWDEDAAAMLERIPGFVRDRVRERTEAAARREAVAVITLAYLRARRPGAPEIAGARPGA